MRRKKEPDGSFIKKTIVRRILDKTDGINESDLRSHLVDQLGIHPSYFKEYLQELEAKNIIRKDAVVGRRLIKWQLSFDNNEVVARYLIQEFSSLSHIDGESKLVALDVFNARATQYFLKNNDWTPLIEKYIIKRHPTFGPNPPSSVELPWFFLPWFLEMIFQPAVAISPSLFCELHEDQEYISVPKNLLYKMENYFKPPSKIWQEPQKLFYFSFLLSFFILDISQYPDIKFKTSEFFDELIKRNVIEPFDFDLFYHDVERREFFYELIF